MIPAMYEHADSLLDNSPSSIAQIDTSWQEVEGQNKITAF